MLKSALILLVVDTIWIQLIMKNRFQKLVKRIQDGRDMTVRLLPAILSYFFLVFGFERFIVQTKASYWDAFLLGIIVYGVFEATSMAIFKDWDYGTFVLDTLWGGMLYVITLYLRSKV